MRRLGFTLGLLVAALLSPAAAADYWLAQARLERVLLEQTLAAPQTQPEQALRDFYQRRRFRPYWLSGDRLNAQGLALLGELAAAERHGLPASAYALPPAPPVAAGASAVHWELALSRAYLALAEDLATGRFEPAQLDPQWHIPRPAADPAAYLAALTEAGVTEALRRQAPRTEAYRHLVAAGERLRRVLARGGWPRLQDVGLLRRGDRHPQVALLRRRLQLDGELPETAPAQPQRFDPALEAALRRFQRRHGLEADGILGPETLAALNVAAAVRWSQLRVNLERQRWLPRGRQRDYLRVNVANYELELVRDGAVELAMPVIVGERDQQTPVFIDQLSYLVFNPYWNIPESIVREEIAPQVLSEENYFARRQMELRESWRPDAPRVDPAAVDRPGYASGRYASFPYRLRQAPGPANPLGRIKFMFPNPFSIYLHDTPHDALFDASQRAFSHGCIRVARPRELAAALLRDAGWDAPAIEEAIGSGETQRVRLSQPLPIFIVYETAWADAQGRPHYRPDLYGRDARLQAQLLGEQADRTLLAQH